MVRAGLVVDPLDLERLGDQLARREAGVQRSERILEDDLYLAAEFTKLAAAGLGEVDSAELDLAGRGLVQSKDQSGGRGLARS